MGHGGRKRGLKSRPNRCTFAGHYDPYVNAPSTPLFDFGFGEPSSFAYSGTTAALACTGPKGPACTVVVKTTVHNLGAAAAVETAQVYATAPLDNIVRCPPVKKMRLGTGSTHS